MKYLYLVIITLIISCEQRTNNVNENTLVYLDSTLKTLEKPQKISIRLTDKTVKFLWRNNKYDETVKDTINSIFINEEFCKTISEPERAALGYVATFVGNECNWEGTYSENRSNLKCKILTALDLGFQCSETPLGFLRQAFKNDARVLEELKSDNCPTTPDGSTIQNTFEEIILQVRGNEISVFFTVNGINLRESKSWIWSETDYFEFDKDNLKLIKKDKSSIKPEHF